MTAALLAPAGGALALALVLGGLLGWAATRLRRNPDRLAERINALLPQTQCGQCLYPGCRPYAEAIARGEANIDRCPPGGSATARAIARLLDRPAVEPDPSFGFARPPQVAWIDEARCIGCARCLPVCPVDAIIGAPRFTHTVIAAQCTGCELCIAPCPVDCIELVPVHPAETVAAPRSPRR